MSSFLFSSIHTAIFFIFIVNFVIICLFTFKSKSYLLGDVFFPPHHVFYCYPPAVFCLLFFFSFLRNMFFNFFDFGFTILQLSTSDKILSSSELSSLLFASCYYNYSDRHSLSDHFINYIYSGKHVLYLERWDYIFFSGIIKPSLLTFFFFINLSYSFFVI